MLKQRHGFSGRLTLTYDMTFLVLLLSALYEADEERGMELCPAHPLRRHFYWQTRYTDYAADMNVVLAYYNCRDDWQVRQLTTAVSDGAAAALAACRYLEEQGQSE